jgi:hypothetical protein
MKFKELLEFIEYEEVNKEYLQKGTSYYMLYTNKYLLPDRDTILYDIRITHDNNIYDIRTAPYSKNFKGYSITTVELFYSEEEAIEYILNIKYFKYIIRKYKIEKLLYI